MTPSEIKPKMKFGHWEVIKFDHVNKHRIKYFLCKCDVCGTIRPVRATSLISGYSTACSKECSDSLVGLTIGNWNVLSLDKSRPRYYICKCKCGTVKSVFKGSLKNGASKSCGCKQPISASKVKSINDIERVFVENNIFFKKNYRLQDCYYSFDYGLFNNQEELIGLITYSNYHYSSRGTGWNTSERKLYIKKGDYIKQKFAEDNKIPLLIIPYSFFNELEKFLTTSDFWNIIIKNFKD